MLEWALIMYQMSTNEPAKGSEDYPQTYSVKQECYDHAARSMGYGAGPARIGESVFIDPNVYGVCRPRQKQ